MKKFLILLATMGITSIALADDNVCAPESAIICTISAVRDASNCDYYQLRTTYQLISNIFVDVNSCSDNIDPDKANAALLKLQANAQALKDAGICKVIINNVN